AQLDFDASDLEVPDTDLPDLSQEVLLPVRDGSDAGIHAGKSPIWRRLACRYRSVLSVGQGNRRQTGAGFRHSRDRGRMGEGSLRTTSVLPGQTSIDSHLVLGRALLQR